MEATGPTSLIIFFTVLLGTLLVVLPRNVAFVPMLVGASYLTLGQRLYVGSLDFTMWRILILFGWFRVAMRGDFRGMRFNEVDKAICAWIGVYIVAHGLLYGSQDAIIQALGQGYDAIGTYFLARLLIRNFDDTRLLVKAMAVIIVPISVLMFYEAMTGKNLFWVFGSVPLEAQVRDGHIRCQGPFGHPILAGTFAASTFPFVFSLWWSDRFGKVLALTGGFSAVLIVMVSRSSGPLIALLTAFVGLLAWAARKHLRRIRWAIVALIAFLHIVMNAPVWFLFARVADLTGGSGWHRGELINQTVTHFGEWWFLGTKYTRHWMESSNPSNPAMIDITNWFVGQAVNGGLATLALFTLIIILAFRRVGLFLNMRGRDSNQTRLAWGIGVAVLAHMMSFMSVVYMDQLRAFWYTLLAMVCALGLRSDPELRTTASVTPINQPACPRMVRLEGTALNTTEKNT